jgi:hypothetical protein
MNTGKRELWEKRIGDYEASGLSGKRWCKEQGISEAQFWYWKKRLKESFARREGGVSTTWAPLVVADSVSQKTALTVRIGAAEIEVKPGYDERLLQNVIQTLMSI